MPKVLITDSMSPRAEEIFRERGVDVDVISGPIFGAWFLLFGGYLAWARPIRKEPF